VKAIVPEVYSDLRRENVLKQYLYYGYNDLNYRWVSYETGLWENFNGLQINLIFDKKIFNSINFSVDSSLLSKESVNLVVYGIDTISSIYINEVLVGKTDNMFVRL